MYQYPYGNAQQLNLDWILSKLQKLEAGSGGGGADLEEVANALVSASFDAGVSYRRYDYCFYNGKLYRALNDNSGAFDPADWLEVTLGADIPVLTRLLNAVDASLTTLQGQVADLDSDDVDNASNVTGTTVTDALDNLNGAITSVENGLAIVANGNTHAAIASGQYVYIKGHGTLAEGLYKATAAIPLNGTLSTSNVATVPNGGLNDVRSTLQSSLYGQNIAGDGSMTIPRGAGASAIVYAIRANTSATPCLWIVDQWGGICAISNNPDLATLSYNSSTYAFTLTNVTSSYLNVGYIYLFP